MPTGIPNSGHRRHPNFRIIRDLKRELRAARAKLDKCHEAREHDILSFQEASKQHLARLGELHNLKAQAESYINQREELRTELTNTKQQFTDLNEYSNQQAENIKSLSHEAALAKKDLANALEGRETSDRLNLERINQLIDVAHALARNC